jgi:hypothetical protein
MPRTCTICRHPEREAIDRALVRSEPYRHIAAQYGVSTTALQRHKLGDLFDTLAASQRARDEAASVDLMAEVGRMFVRVNLLFDACDAWLRDADDPSKYDIGPRSDEILVTYAEQIDVTDSGDPVYERKKAPLSELLRHASTAGEIKRWETKYADPRDLILKTADRLKRQCELLGELLGKLSRNPQISVLVAPEWLKLRGVLVEALRPYPEARAAVADRLAELEADARRDVH